MLSINLVGLLACRFGIFVEKEHNILLKYLAKEMIVSFILLLFDVLNAQVSFCHWWYYSLSSRKCILHNISAINAFKTIKHNKTNIQILQ